MNVNYWLKKIFFRATCILQTGAKLSKSARIINISGNSDRIRIGKCSFVSAELLVFPHGGEIVIGDWCYIGDGSRLWSGSSIIVGNNVMISHNVNVIDNQTHPISHLLRRNHFKNILQKGHPSDINLGDKPIRIDDDAWLSTGVIVLRGVHIGRGAIIGAGSVVTRDIPPFCIAVGNPARVMRELTDSEINELPSVKECNIH